MDLKNLKNRFKVGHWKFLALFLLSLVGFFDLLSDHLTAGLLHSIEQETLSIGLLLEIKFLLASSSKVPLVGAASAAVIDSLATVIKYLSWSDMILTTQLILLKISGSLVFKSLLFLALMGLIVKAYRGTSLKILLIILFINPGIPAYIALSNSISHEVKLNKGSELHEKIRSIHQKYSEKEAKRQEKEAARNQKQLEEAKKKGKNGISKLKRFEDKIEDAGQKIFNRVEEGVAEGIAILKTGSKELLIMAINYISTVAIQFLVLPFLFLYAVSKLIKNIVLNNVAAPFINKVIGLLFITVLIAGVSHMTAQKPVEKTAPATTKENSSSLFEAQKDGPILGIDVSHFQKDVNWEEIKKANISFAYAKATQSTKFVDPKFSKNWIGIKEAGLRRGAYHFYMAGEDPQQQAESFIRVVGEIEKEEMPPMLDLEEAGMKPGINTKEYQENVFIWLSAVEKAFGRTPIIYTDHPFGNKYLTDPKFKNYGLWIADWQKRADPIVPEVWDGKWVIWQRTEKGQIEGEIGDVDHDLLHPNAPIFKHLK